MLSLLEKNCVHVICSLSKQTLDISCLKVRSWFILSKAPKWFISYENSHFLHDDSIVLFVFFRFSILLYTAVESHLLSYYLLIKIYDKL